MFSPHPFEHQECIPPRPEHQEYFPDLHEHQECLPHHINTKSVFSRSYMTRCFERGDHSNRIEWILEAMALDELYKHAV